MKSEFYKRYYASNIHARHLFFIEILGEDEGECYIFKSSLPLEVFNLPDVSAFAEKIIQIKLSIEERDELTEELIEKLKSIPGMEKNFFSKDVLDKLGQYCEPYVKTLRKIVEDTDPVVFFPYSVCRNKHLYDEIKECFEYYFLISNSVLIEKKIFEAKFANQYSLQRAYVEVYCRNAKYYFQKFKNDAILFEFYFMTIESEMVFLFFTVITKNRSP